MRRPAPDPAQPSSLDPSRPPHQAGDVVAERFRVEQVLSATQVQRGLPVALTFLRYEATRQTVDRFFPAGRDAARSSNDAPGRVLDIDRAADGTPFLVMESLEGFELQKMVDEPGWLPVNTAVDFAIQACEGIALLHGARIVRRDLLRTLSSLRGRTSGILGKRIAFGVPKLAPTRALNGSGVPGARVQALARWPIYAAPERMGVARPAAHFDPPADIWSLGVLLYELLGGGCSPFEAATFDEVCSRILLDGPDALSVVRPDLPLGLETVVYRCLEKDPTRRYPDAQSLAIALAPYASRNGQLRARRLQHSRPQGHSAQLFNPRRSLPPILPPPRYPNVPALPGPTGTVRLLAAAPDSPREPRVPRSALTTVRMPSRPIARSIAESLPPARASRHDPPGVRPRFSVLFICVAVALSVLGVLLGTVVIAIRAQRGSAPRAQSTAAGIANHMPEEPPAAVTIAPRSIEAPIAAQAQAPVETEHVYAPEELPIAAPSAHAAPLRPFGKNEANRVGPDGF